MIHQHPIAADDLDPRLGTPQAHEVMQPIYRKLEHVERCHGHMSRQYADALGEHNVARNFNDLVLALVAQGICWTEARELAVKHRAAKSNVVRVDFAAARGLVVVL